MKKIILFSVLVVMALIIGCAEELADEEVDGALGELSDEDLELAAESEESALAGNAKYQRYKERDPAKAKKIKGLKRSMNRQKATYECSIVGEDIRVTKNGKKVRQLPASYCRNGVRERYCKAESGTSFFRVYGTRAGAACAENEQCQDGQCQANLCGDQACAPGEECNARTNCEVAPFCEDDDPFVWPTSDFMTGKGNIRIQGTILNSKGTPGGAPIAPVQDSCNEQGQLVQVECQPDGVISRATTDCPGGTQCELGACIDEVFDAEPGVNEEGFAPGVEAESFCGNGVVDPGEECDDGQHCSRPVNGQVVSCTTNAECGNGVCGPFAADGCSANCQLECGDNVVQSNEECDDGNMVGGDGCSASCMNEAPAPGPGDSPGDDVQPVVSPCPDTTDFTQCGWGPAEILCNNSANFQNRTLNTVETCPEGTTCSGPRGTAVCS